MRAGQKVTLPSGLVVRWPKGAFYLTEACPRREEHSPYPADFNPDALTRSSRTSRTHVQRKHDVCGLWTQWIPREVAKAKVVS